MNSGRQRLFRNQGLVVVIWIGKKIWNMIDQIKLSVPCRELTELLLSVEVVLFLLLCLCVGKKTVSKQREEETVPYLLSWFPIRKYALRLYVWQAGVHILAHTSHFVTLTACQHCRQHYQQPVSQTVWIINPSVCLQSGRRFCGVGQYLASLVLFLFLVHRREGEEQLEEWRKWLQW